MNRFLFFIDSLSTWGVSLAWLIRPHLGISYEVLVPTRSCANHLAFDFSYITMGHVSDGRRVSLSRNDTCRRRAHRLWPPRVQAAGPAAVFPLFFPAVAAGSTRVNYASSGPVPRGEHLQSCRHPGFSVKHSFDNRRAAPVSGFAEVIGASSASAKGMAAAPA